jgi:3-deoxy-D-manno-octulosonic-acid transferase
MFALLIYRLALFCLLPIVLILLLVRSKSNRAYRQRLLERLGFFPQQRACSDSHSTPIKQGGILVHAASVGEVIALKSFIEALLAAYPKTPITITTFTPTGSEQVKKLFADKVQHSYLPLDIFPCTQLFLQRLQPTLVIFMETELWPNLVAQCLSKNIKLLLINGRLSKKSLNSYQKINALITPCLNSFDKILTQSQENLTHFTQLGAQPARCSNVGNLKFDISINASIQTKQQELSQLINAEGSVNNAIDRKVWLVASTHEGDEAIALAAFRDILKSFPQLLLVRVPRHPERFEHVAQLCQQQGFSLARRSENTPVTEQQIWLLDSLGELMAGFSLSDIVTMGGSFSAIGGHNPLEPALFKKPIIVGSNMSNFSEILQQLLQQKALIQLQKDKPEQQLAQAVLSLLQDPAQQISLGAQAHEVVLANQGASNKTLAQVQELLSIKGQK